MVMGSYLTMITLNISGLNAPKKRERLAEWTQKPDPYYILSKKDQLQTKGCIQTERRVGKRYFIQKETKRKQE